MSRLRPKFAEKFDESHLLSCWDEAVGAVIAKHAQPQRVSRNQIVVQVDHPIWKNELFYKKNLILKRLTEVFEKRFEKPFPKEITDLWFV